MLRNYLPTSRAGRGRAEAALGLIVEATTRTTSTHASYLFACRADPQFLNRCTKPTKAEYIQLCRAVGVGFLVMGFIGYIVKVVHLPINNILVCVRLPKGKDLADSLQRRSVMFFVHSIHTERTVFCDAFVLYLGSRRHLLDGSFGAMAHPTEAIRWRGERRLTGRPWRRGIAARSNHEIGTEEEIYLRLRRRLHPAIVGYIQLDAHLNVTPAKSSANLLFPPSAACGISSHRN